MTGGDFPGITHPEFTISNIQIYLSGARGPQGADYNVNALTNSYWASPVPDTLMSALNRMAAKLYALNSNTAIP